ncbi:GNAT family N-acetyltransferase [Aporhodopirellula aestuarii]|uniref:GNAT family N-acetyltransferase n=1 Tax=Aporhodopirellula aestuarii TaxID=2950107 RepID=A0ABT0TZZ3_9BACT|nr:GNAT family N-acetyltransferase [Aporhodopirellula aestuarii]MCM2370218.1 GNAT family N-acetyltransferase [Aporhodopirellula aestuarii]
MSIRTLVADYRLKTHRVAILRLLSEYSADPAIGGSGLPFAVRQRVVDELARRDNAVSLLAVDDGNDNGDDDGFRPVGLINAFETFSTFTAMPVLNIHDVMVTRSHRGRGIGRQLIEAATDVAKQRGCCKVTLEVYRGNQAAAKLYRSCDFRDPPGNRDLGETLFLTRKLK